MTEILLIDEQPERSERLARAIGEQGIHATTSQYVPDPTQLADYHCLVGLDRLIDEQLNQLCEHLPTIVITESGSIPAAVSYVRRGALDYLPLPLDHAALLAAIERGAAQNNQQQHQNSGQFPLVGGSDVMQVLKDGINKVAPTDSTVLILGQSGTGKELVARALHAASTRANEPLISLNCATLPQNLVEQELFGLEQLENPRDSRKGLVETADGGTLFLDEIAELPSAAQARLLRVMQGENRRVGSSTTQRVNVRIIAATHRNLLQLTQSGAFREDLFYRLNVVCFELPPLAQRKTDVLELADWLLERTCARLNKNGLTFDANARDAMLNYHWPGNVRELENAVERAVILSDNNGVITQSLLAIEPQPNAAIDQENPQDGQQTSLEDYFVRFVLDHQDQLTETELAEKLGISRKSLWERRQRLNIPRRKTRKRGPRRDANTA